MRKNNSWTNFGILVAFLAAPLNAKELQELGETKKSDETIRRFDLVVREHIFAGFAGDEDALKRGESECEKALKENPKNAEALVWRGAVHVFQTGGLFGKGKVTQAMPLWTSGIKDMDDAVKLEPDNVGVRIPGTHPRGELRMGLGDTYRLMGKMDKSVEQLEALINELPDSEYEAKAKVWLAAKPNAKLSHSCIGCHSQ